MIFGFVLVAVLTLSAGAMMSCARTDLVFLLSAMGMIIGMIVMGMMAVTWGSDCSRFMMLIGGMTAGGA